MPTLRVGGVRSKGRLVDCRQRPRVADSTNHSNLSAAFLAAAVSQGSRRDPHPRRTASPIRLRQFVPYQEIRTTSQS